MTKERIEKAVEIINYAIKNQISVKEASVACGYADTYVKNIKAVVYEKYEYGTLEDELFNQFDSAYKDYEFYRKNKEITIKEPTNIKVSEPNKPNDLPSATENEKTNYSEKGNVADIEWVGGRHYPPDHIKTLPELLKICEVDMDVWQVAEHRVNKWDVTAVIDKVPQTFQNFQVKARLIRRPEVIKEKLAGQVFLNMIKGYVAPKLDVTKFEIRPDENNLFEASIFDLHMGKLAWGGETGENYDTKIARKRFLDAITDLLINASRFDFSRILFPVGNDFFNSDTIFNTTTQGTQQDEDLRWQKTFNVGVQLLVDAINLLKQTGFPVDVVVIPGNHDFERSYYMGKFLEAWFNNDETITIINGASPRKYYRFGKVLLGFTHGSEEKESSLPLLMATDIESKPMWSETIYHEWHLGHIHRKRNVNYSVVDNKQRTLSEDLGVTVRYLSSLTGTEEWHHKKGFVGAIKAADGFIWNDERGLIAHLNSNIKIINE
mgnify:CR=1 FL=1|jgi:hypothetical protein